MLAKSIRRRPLISYFLLAFGITWGGILFFLWSKQFQFDQIQMADIPIMFLFMILGPSTSSIVHSLILEGPHGLRVLWELTTPKRVSGKWYAIALLTVPAAAFVILTALSLVVSTDFAPRFEFVGLAIGLIAGMFEELGWTGFGTRQLLQKYSILVSGLLLGAIWAVWHMAADYAGNIDAMGTDWPLYFLVFWVLTLIPYRILMTWVFSETQSLIIAQLMHASYTGWLLTLSPAATFEQNLLWQSIFAGTMWLIAGLFLLKSKKRRAAL